MTDVVMPKLSEGMSEGKLLRWCVAEGQQVQEGDVIAEVETDKANMEIEALVSGAVAVFRAQPGEMIQVGGVMAVIDETVERHGTRPVTGSPGMAMPDLPGVNASPIAVRLAQQRGIDLSQVRGTGPFGRIMKEDVLAFERTPPPPARADVVPIEAPPPAAVEPEPEPLALTPSPEPSEQPIFSDEAEPTNDFFPDMEGDAWDGGMATASLEPAADDDDEVQPISEKPLQSSDVFMASVHINVSALHQAAPVLCERMGSSCGDAATALAPVYVKAAGVAFARVFDRECTVALVQASRDGATRYQLITGCAAAMLPTLLQQCSPERALQIPPADADVALLNAGATGVDEFMGLAGAPAGALLALGAARETAEARGGRIERAHVCKATVTVKTGEWPLGKALAFVQEFRQLLEHPVLLVGV